MKEIGHVMKKRTARAACIALAVLAAIVATDCIGPWPL